MPIEFIFILMVSVPFYVAITQLLGEPGEEFIDEAGRKPAALVAFAPNLATKQRLAVTPAAHKARRALGVLPEPTQPAPLMLQSPIAFTPDPLVKAKSPEDVFAAGPARLTNFDPEDEQLVVLYSGFIAPSPVFQVVLDEGLKIRFSDGASVLLEGVSRHLQPCEFAFQSSIAPKAAEVTQVA